MQIANPIYDAVFKFMMNDNKVAKLLLSAIIGEEILELTFQPTELEVPLQESITVLRMDFKALVQYSSGEKKIIIIEIQKAKLHTDIMRFRRYLGEQYSDQDNAEIVKKVDKVGNVLNEHKKAYPILSIYFLGHKLNHAKNIPVIKVARSYYDLATGKVLSKKEDFIESLTHDSFIIQIPFISGHRRTELEQLLHVFDQKEAETKGSQHLLNIKEEDIPKRYRRVLRRLLEAVADARTRKLMQAEDELISELQGYTRLIEQQSKALNSSIKLLIQLNQSNQKIAETLSLSIDYVEQIRKNLSD